jgi:hypothetical protein
MRFEHGGSPLGPGTLPLTAGFSSANPSMEATMAYHRYPIAGHHHFAESGEHTALAVWVALALSLLIVGSILFAGTRSAATWSTTELSMERSAPAVPMP